MKLQYPYPMDGKLPARVHDPNKDLINKNPRPEWAPGDTCFIYHTKPHLIRFCLVTAAYSSDEGKRYSVQTIDEEPGDTFSVTTEEMFQTKKEIDAAFFAETAG